MTVSCNLILTTVVFIGAHAHRIKRVSGCRIIREDSTSVWYDIGELPNLARDVTSSGWTLRVAP
jgi:hypothetical protein